MAFSDLDAAVRECQRLLESGYVRRGKWSLGQICHHMRLTIEANIQGYPAWMTALGYPLRPLLRWLLLPRLLSTRSPAGLKTAPQFVPPQGLNDAQEVERLARCVEEFQSSPGRLHPHPAFGKMSRAEFGRFHAAHAAHHLGFLDIAPTAHSYKPENGRESSG